MLVLLLPYATLWLACQGCSSEKSNREMPPLELGVAVAECDSLAEVMTFPCVTYALYEVKLEPRVAGYLQSVGYAQGGEVKKNQLLFTIESSEYIAEVAEAKASLLSAKAEKVNAENTYNRYRPLWEKRAISRSQLDEATAQLAEARAAVNSAKASLYNAEQNLGDTKAYAPFDGIIGQTNGAVGEYVGLGTEYSVINTVSNIDSIYVYLSIPTTKYLQIAARDPQRKQLYNDRRMIHSASMQRSDGSLYPYEGSYKFTARAINNQTGSVVFHILFPNPEAALRPGEYVTIRAEVGESQPVVLIPQRCVMQNQGQNGVFVVDSGDTVKYKKVELGKVYNDKWEIKQGLAEGDKILAEGLQKVHSGDKIIPKTLKARR